MNVVRDIDLNVVINCLYLITMKELIKQEHKDLEDVSKEHLASILREEA